MPTFYTYLGSQSHGFKSQQNCYKSKVHLDKPRVLQKRRDNIWIEIRALEPEASSLLILLPVGGDLGTFSMTLEKDPTISG